MRLLRSRAPTLILTQGSERLAPVPAVAGLFDHREQAGAAFALLEDPGRGPGSLVEILQQGEGGPGLFAMIKQAGEGWDGSEPLRALG